MIEHTSAELGTADELPMDPDVDAAEDARHRSAAGAGPFERTRPRRWPRLEARILVVIFAGGVGGGLARYVVTQAWPTPTHAFPWATFVVNTAGAFALALLLVVLVEVWAPHRYVRPLLGTGFLGAFTTFSGVTVAADQLAAHGHARTALIYLGATVLAALGAASFGLLLGRVIGATRHRHRDVRTPRRR
ncbi:MAG: fluoride efflux transporter FluC [Mycobacteriales bacterium]